MACRMRIPVHPMAICCSDNSTTNPLPLLTRAYVSTSERCLGPRFHKDFGVCTLLKNGFSPASPPPLAVPQSRLPPQILYHDFRTRPGPHSPALQSPSTVHSLTQPLTPSSGTLQLLTPHHHRLSLPPRLRPLNDAPRFQCLHPPSASVHSVPCTSGNSTWSLPVIHAMPCHVSTPRRLAR